MVLPPPPDDLPAAPRAFYDGLRAVVAALEPSEVDLERSELHFGDGGVGVTFCHAREDVVLAAQVSRRAAVVFAGPLTAHFSDAGGGDWTRPAVELMARALRGEVEVPVTTRGGAVVRVGDERVWSTAGLAFWRPVRTEVVRLDFGARRAG